MTFNVLVETESQLIAIEAETEADAIELAMDSAMQNVVFQVSIVPQAD